MKKIEVASGLPKSNRLPAKPFVKWVGGKRSIISDLESRMPASMTRYYEPFVGGGALYFNMQPDNAYLSDVNFNLIITYRAIRDDVNGVISNLKIHGSKHCESYYLKARNSFRNETDNIKISALFIYLNKTCFNGLYRVNKSGCFNVPMGDYKNPLILDETNLINVSKVLADAEIVQHEFDQTPIEKSAFYYLDPPYHQAYSNYASGGFVDKEHEKLASYCHKIHTGGAYFMLSNSNTDLVRSLYGDYCIETVAGLRCVSCKAHQRGRKDEYIIRNYE